MKRFLPAIAIVLALIAASSCGNSKLTQAEEQNHRLDDSLRTALAASDTMYSLLYDVTVGLEQITQLEHLLDAQIDSENPNARADIQAKMEAIQRGLISRRQRIAELEQQLANSNGEHAQLRKRLNELRSQIDAQAATVRDLTGRLEAANIRINVLQDSITEIVAQTDATIGQMQEANAQVEQQLTETENALNTVYYVIGTKDELKAHGFIEGGGFLKSSKLGKEFEIGYMTAVDKRTFSTLPLDAKKVKIYTDQPESSYTIDKDANGMLTLRITNPSAFWARRNFLVIEAK